MEVIITKFTSIEEAKKCIETSVYSKTFKSHLKDLRKLYFTEHSPMYSQIFMLELKQIPYYLHTHLRTHKTHFITETVTTGRLDMGADETEFHSTDYRHRPVNMIIMCNAKTLIDISRKRLCSKADSEMRDLWNKVRDIMKSVDKELYRYMVPQCVYRGGICPEVFGTGCCGYIHTKKFKDQLYSYLGELRLTNYWIND